jgi:hypothetical protein
MVVLSPFLPTPFRTPSRRMLVLIELACNRSERGSIRPAGPPKQRCLGAGPTDPVFQVNFQFNNKQELNVAVGAGHELSMDVDLFVQG